MIVAGCKDLVKHERVSHREDPKLNFMGTVTAVNTDETGYKTYDVAWEGDEESNGTYSRGDLVARHDDDAIEAFRQRTQHAPMIAYGIDHFTWYKAWCDSSNRLPVLELLSEVHSALWGPPPWMECKYCESDARRFEEFRREERKASRERSRGFLLVEPTPVPFAQNPPPRSIEDAR